MASGNTLIVLTARDGIPTATSGAAHGVFAGAATPADGVPFLAFDSASDEYADFPCVLPRHYAGGGLTLTLYWFSTQTSGTCRWGAAIRRVQDDAEDIDTTAHSYDFNTVGATTASAAGELNYATITFTDGADMDSLAVGEYFILRIFRDGDGTSGTDDLTGDAGLVAIEIKET